MTTIDPELGPMRWCGRCQEWWPDDDEFFYRRIVPAGVVCTANGRPYTRRTPTVKAWCRGCTYTAKNARRRVDFGDKPLPARRHASENQGAIQLTNGGASMSVTQR